MGRSAHESIELVVGGAGRREAPTPARVARMQVLPDAVTTGRGRGGRAGRRGRADRQLAGLRRRRHAAAGLTSGAHRVDTGKVAASRRQGAPRRPGLRPRGHRPGDRRRRPVGHPEQVRTLVDSALEQYDEVWAAGGSTLVFPTTFAELVAVTGGEPADEA